MPDIRRSEVETGSAQKGRLRKRWLDCVEEDWSRKDGGLEVSDERQQSV